MYFSNCVYKQSCPRFLTSLQLQPNIKCVHYARRLKTQIKLPSSSFQSTKDKIITRVVKFNVMLIYWQKTKIGIFKTVSTKTGCTFICVFLLEANRNSTKEYIYINVLFSLTLPWCRKQCFIQPLSMLSNHCRHLQVQYFYPDTAVTLCSQHQYWTIWRLPDITSGIHIWAKFISEAK